MVVPYGDLEIIQRCQGHPAVHTILSQPQLFNLTAECSLNTAEWQATGIKQMAIEVETYYPTYLTIPRLELKYPESFQTKIDVDIGAREYSRFRLGDIPSLTPLSNDNNVEGKSFLEQYWGYLVTVGICFTLCIGIIIFFKWNSIKLSPLSKLFSCGQLFRTKPEHIVSTLAENSVDIEMQHLSPSNIYTKARTMLNDVEDSQQ